MQDILLSCKQLSEITLYYYSHRIPFGFNHVSLTTVRIDYIWDKHTAPNNEELTELTANEVQCWIENTPEELPRLCIIQLSNICRSFLLPNDIATEIAKTWFTILCNYKEKEFLLIRCKYVFIPLIRKFSLYKNNTWINWRFSNTYMVFTWL